MNKKLIISSAALAVLLILPMIVLALTPPDLPGDNLNVANALDGIIGFIWPIFGAASVITFIWAGFLFLTAHGDPNKTLLASKAVIWGMVGLAIAMFSAWLPFIIKAVLGL